MASEDKTPADGGEGEEELNDVYINPEDGMPNSHPNMLGIERAPSDSEEERNVLDDLPRSLIVTNIHSEVFADERLKRELEQLFHAFSPEATFQWLRSFKRLRVNFEGPAAAANARIQLHQFKFYKTSITCYFAQPVTPVTVKNLRPPAPVKQFLISPPSSPPLGWQPREENEPLVNHDLLAALATLAPGECCELHPRSADHPAIVVHTALAPAHAPPATARIPHTRCPDY